MIRKSVWRFSERDHAQTNELERDDDLKKRHPVLARVLDIRLRAIASRGSLGAPLAVQCLVLDHLGTAGCALFGGGALAGRERRGMASKRVRQHAVDGLGPDVVV